MLRFMGSQRVGHDGVAELTELNFKMFAVFSHSVVSDFL